MYPSIVHLNSYILGPRSYAEGQCSHPVVIPRYGTQRVLQGPEGFSAIAREAIQELISRKEKAQNHLIFQLLYFYVQMRGQTSKF